MVQMISESKRKIAALALAGAMAIGGAAGVATTIASPAQNQSGIVMEAEAAATPAVGDWVKCTVKSGNVYQTFDGAKSQNSSNIVGSLSQGQLKQIKEIKTAKINGNTKYFYKIPYDTKSTNGYAWINSAIVSTDLQIEEYMKTATKNTNICRDKNGKSIGSVVVNTTNRNGFTTIQASFNFQCFANKSGTKYETKNFVATYNKSTKKVTVYGKTTGEHTFNIYVKNAEGKWCYRDFTIRVGNSSKLAYKGTKSVDRQQHSDYKDVYIQSIYLKNGSYEWMPDIEYQLWCNKPVLGWVKKNGIKKIGCTPSKGYALIEGVWTRHVEDKDIKAVDKSNAKGRIQIRFVGESTWKDIYF